MSSSYRNAQASIGLRVIGAHVLAAAFMSSAAAADTYFVPIASAGAEYDSNRSMNPDSSSAKSLEGYFGSVEALIGARTPRSSTDIRPRVRYQTFPSEKRFDQTEVTLDWKSEFKTLRSDFNFLGRFARQDLFNDEFVNVGFDPFDPDAPPPTTDAGRVVVSEKRTRAELRPSYIYRWNETTGVGVDLQYQNVRYSADIPLDKQDYDNWQGNLNFVRRLSPKSELTAGGYVGRFKTKDGLEKSDSVGASLEVSHNWSKQTNSELTLVVERGKATFYGPSPGEETNNEWGLQFSTIRRGEISRLRFVIGRDLAPSGSGGRASRDEVRGQYDRDLSQRWVFTTALRAFRQRALATRNANTSSNRDVATIELSMNWAVTPTWSLRGGYAHNWQDIVSSTGSASNNRVFLNLNYRALDSRRRN